MADRHTSHQQGREISRVCGYELNWVPPPSRTIYDALSDRAGHIREGKSPDDKKNSAFVLIFLEISTIFASFSRAHPRTLQNHSISPCTTTVWNNTVESSTIFHSNLMLATHQLVLWNLVVIHIIIVVAHETIDGQPRCWYIITFGLAYGSGQPFSLAHSTT
jgi:hypothetical protein